MPTNVIHHGHASSEQEAQYVIERLMSQPSGQALPAPIAPQQVSPGELQRQPPHAAVPRAVSSWDISSHMAATTAANASVPRSSSDNVSVRRSSSEFDLNIHREPPAPMPKPRTTPPTSNGEFATTMGPPLIPSRAPVAARPDPEASQFQGPTGLSSSYNAMSDGGYARASSMPSESVSPVPGGGLLAAATRAPPPIPQRSAVPVQTPEDGGAAMFAASSGPLSHYSNAPGTGVIPTEQQIPKKRPGSMMAGAVAVMPNIAGALAARQSQRQGSVQQAEPDNTADLVQSPSEGQGQWHPSLPSPSQPSAAPVAPVPAPRKFVPQSPSSPPHSAFPPQEDDSYSPTADSSFAYDAPAMPPPALVQPQQPVMQQAQRAPPIPSRSSRPPPTIPPRAGGGLSDY